MSKKFAINYVGEGVCPNCGKINSEEQDSEKTDDEYSLSYQCNNCDCEYTEYGDVFTRYCYDRTEIEGEE